MQTEVIDWLMTGDASIRWQVQRDLLGKPPEEYQAEQAQVAETGWGAELLARQDEDGKWGGGWYSPKWTSTTYTLLLLFQMGLLFLLLLPLMRTWQMLLAPGLQGV